MAVAGLVLLCEEGKVDAVRALLTAHAGISTVQLGEEACRVVAVLEVDSDLVESNMTALRVWDGVLSVDLAFVSYEDELEAGKSIKCPPHVARHTRPAPHA
ncbi:MAG: chaperone NapD [Desulfovibrionaceae bacterium]